MNTSDNLSILMNKAYSFVIILECCYEDSSLLLAIGNCPIGLHSELVFTIRSSKVNVLRDHSDGQFGFVENYYNIELFSAMK